MLFVAVRPRKDRGALGRPLLLHIDRRGRRRHRWRQGKGVRRDGDPRDRRRLKARGVFMRIRGAKVEGGLGVALGFEEEHLLDVAQRCGRQGGRGQRGHSGGAVARPVGGVGPVRVGYGGEREAEGVPVGGRGRHLGGSLHNFWVWCNTMAGGIFFDLFRLFQPSSCPKRMT